MSKHVTDNERQRLLQMVYDGASLAAVIELVKIHRYVRRHEAEDVWLAGLAEEFAELASALAGIHYDSPDWELLEIASIALNWLDYRRVRRRTERQKGGDL